MRAAQLKLTSARWVACLADSVWEMYGRKHERKVWGSGSQVGASHMWGLAPVEVADGKAHAIPSPPTPNLLYTAGLHRHYHQGRAQPCVSDDAFVGDMQALLPAFCMVLLAVAQLACIQPSSCPCY